MNSRRLFSFCIWTVFIACLSLALDRLHCAVSFTKPWLITTSNTEDEDLYSIWKVAHGQSAYNDPTQIPFTMSYYNWLFYGLYGTVTAFFLHLLQLGDIWLPNIARLLTLFFALAISAFYFAILRRNLALRDFCPAYLLVALSLIATLNPLFGFWIMTARPDVGALAFEIAGIFFLVIHLSRRRLVFALLAGLAFYLAWSFKQTAVTGLVAATLTLLFHRRFAALVFLLLPWIVLVALTLSLGGRDYHYGVITYHTGFTFFIGQSLEIFFSTLAKVPVLPLIIIVLFADALRSARAGKLDALPPEETLFLFATVTALLFGLITACKDGAADNYFLPFSVWSGLWFFRVLPRLDRSYFSAACLGVTALFLGGISLVFLGRAGMIDRRASDLPNEILAQELRKFPAPVFVTDTYGDLPWIQPHPPYFVVPDIHKLETLIDQGYFGTIITLRQEKLSDAALARYELTDHDAYFYYYVRK